MIRVPHTITLIPFGNERITARLDVGSFGGGPFFEIPLCEDFGGLGFPLSLAVPFAGDGHPRLVGLSFYYSLTVGADSLTLGRAGAVIKISSINRGSHSFHQVYKSGLTKVRKYNFHMSLKTMGKGFAMNYLSGYGDTAYSILYSWAEDNGYL